MPRSGRPVPITGAALSATFLPVGKWHVFSERFQRQIEALGFNINRVAAESGNDPSVLYKIRDGKLLPSDEVADKLSPVIKVPVSTLLAWADEDRLGEDRSRELARQVLADDPTTLAAELFLGRPSGSDISTEPLTAAELGRVVEALAAADPGARQRILKALPPGTLAKLRGALFGPGPVPSEEDRRSREDPPEKAV